MIKLIGKTAIVTGASQGIGLAAARRLSRAGANIVLTARSTDKIERAAAEMNEDGASALAVPCDVTRYNDVARAVRKTLDAFGAVDILVNNAGVIDPIARLGESDPELWNIAVDTNFKGIYHGLRAAIPVMERQEGGVIINISSGAANSALEGWSHYCATKAAAKKLTECAHAEVGHRGVRIVGLSPGTVATEMMAKIRESGVNPVSRLDWSAHKSPEEVAEAILFLCGPEGEEFAGTDFSIKTEEGRRRVGLA